MGKYDQIFDMEQPVDPKHPRMSLHNRAAQFSPFDALTGFDGRIYEASRLTDDRIELTENAKQAIDMQLQLIEQHLREHPRVTVTYFVPDRTKAGGSYQTLTASVQKIDLLNGQLLLEDELFIAFADILDLALAPV